MADIGWRRRRGGRGNTASGQAGGGGGAPPPPPPPRLRLQHTFMPAGFTHNSSSQSKNPLTAITVSTATQRDQTAHVRRYSETDYQRATYSFPQAEGELAIVRSSV